MLNVGTESGQGKLIAALAKVGMEAQVWDSGGGIELVCVTLVDEPGRMIAAAASSNASPCDVGLISDPPELTERAEWRRAKSVREATGIFLTRRAAV